MQDVMPDEARISLVPLCIMDASAVLSHIRAKAF